MQASLSYKDGEDSLYAPNHIIDPDVTISLLAV